MRSARIAEWILSQVLPPDRAGSTVGDWLEDATERGRLWFWSCVLRTVFSRIWSDFAESPGFMVGLALRSWLYYFWLIVGTYFGLILGVFIIMVPVALLAFLADQIHWRPSWTFHPPAKILEALIGQIWIGWCEFKTGRWMARRAPGREFAAGILAYIAPMIFFFPLGLLATHFWGAEINRFVASHPDNPGSLPSLLPSEIFLFAGILWSRHKSLQSVAR
jgi:hypothetical protein